MGVVKRQGIKQSIVNYAGVAIGALSMIFIYAQATDIYGFARFIIDTAFLAFPFILLGSNAVAIRFFPTFQNDAQQHNGFLGFLMLFPLIGGLLFLGSAYLFQDYLMDIYADRPKVYTDQLYKIGFLTVLIAIFSLLYNYVTNFKRIVVPSIFLNLIKLSLPTLVLLCLWEKISINFMANGILISYLVSLIGLLIYTARLGQLHLTFDLDFIDKPLFKNIRSFAIYSLFGGIGGMLAFKIDSVMVPTLLDFKNNGVYNIAAFIGNAIAIPTAAIIQISSPLLSESFNKGDLKHVNFLYKRSSINLLIFGLLLFILIIASVQDLFALMPGRDFDITIGFYIVLILGATRIIDMATSVNTQVISYSAYYRFNLFAILTLSILNVLLNLALIPEFQIIGAALATFISITLFNLMKLSFIYYKLQLQPFTTDTISIFLIAGITFAVAYMMPDFSHPFVNMILKSVVIIFIYVPVVLYFQVSKEVNDLFFLSWRKVKSLIKGQENK